MPKKFHFRFESVLSLRRNRRDQQRQALAEVLQLDAQLVNKRAELERERQDQLEELRSTLRAGTIDVDAAAARRFHVAHLVVETHRVDQQRQVVAERIVACRRALVKADQDVKVLERLSDDERQVYLYQQEQASSRELEETWQAAQLSDGK